MSNVEFAGQVQNQATITEHDGKAKAKKVSLWGYDATNDTAYRLGGLGKLVTEKFDYVAVAYPTGATETYTFYSGGSAGTLVATVALVYTDSTKANLSTATRT